MKRDFPDAKFEIRIKEDATLSNGSMVFLKIAYNCKCYEVRPPQQAEFIKVCGSSPIMISDAIRAMVEYGVNPDCKHYVLDGFVKNSDVQFTVVFGLPGVL